MRITTIAIVVLIATGPSATAAPLPDFKGTVDAWTPAMIARARYSAENAGYRPTAVEFVQDKNVFLTATRANQIYEITLTRSGKLFVSTGTPEPEVAPVG